MTESIYAQVNSLYSQLGAQVREGVDVALPPMRLSHHGVRDTKLAACLATLNIPLREPAPYTDAVALDQKENEGPRQKCWWVGESAESDTPDKPHRTDALLGAWIQRERFEREHPLHPLVAMRAALDARDFWLQAIHASRAGRGTLPAEFRASVPADQPYVTSSINAAALLKACGYQPLAFSGRAFYLQMVNSGVHAERVLESAKEAGATPEKWMSRVLYNYSEMVKLTQMAQTIIRQDFGGGQTLLLSADSTRKTRDQFHGLIDTL